MILNSYQNLQILIMIILQYQKLRNLEIMRNLEITKNIDIKNYNMKYTSTEITAGGTVIHSKPSSQHTNNRS